MLVERSEGGGFTILAGLPVVAHEWDIDPASAQRLLNLTWTA